MFLCFDHQQPVVCTFLACEGLPGLHTLHRVCFDWCESRRRVKAVYQRSSDTGSVHTGVFTLHHTCNMHRSLSRQCDVCRGRREHFLTSGHYWFVRTLAELQRATNVSWPGNGSPKPGFTFSPGSRFTILFLIHNFPSFHQISSGAWAELWVTNDDWTDARQSSWHDSRRVPESNSSGFRALSIRLITFYSQHQLRYTLVWIKTKF